MMSPNKIASRFVETPIDDRALDAMIGEARIGIERDLQLIRRPEARVGVILSPVGRLLVAESNRGLAAIHYLAIDGAERTLEMLRKKFDLIENQARARRIGTEIDRLFKGDLSVLAHRVDLTLVESDFQRRALISLRTVPAGAVITYQGLAAAVGHPNSQRAIGTTMATNPVPIFVPCHRVIKSDGSIGNYGGGVENKLKLLRAEGFAVGRDLRLPPGAVMGHRKTRIFCRPECSAAKRADSSRTLYFADAQSAAKAGLRACKLCGPA